MKSKMRRLHIGARLARLALCAGLVAAGAGCASSSSRKCGEMLSGGKESPGRRYTAAVFLRVCSGTPQQAVTHVNLHGGLGEPPPDAEGLITSGEVFAVEGAHKVNLTWKDAKNLSVECEDCGGRKVLKREASWNDVRVAFDVK